MRLGATYSHREIINMGLDHAKAWPEVLDLGFAVLRLAAYWDEIEPHKGEFDISSLETMIKDCRARGQRVVVAVGMKAPRWPEYYVPKWLKIEQPAEAEEAVLDFIGRVVEVLKGYECIEAWQVENEPLDGSGPHTWKIPIELLSREVALVRRLDAGRPIQVTVWGNSLSSNDYLPQLTELADVVGLDIYYQTPKNPQVWQKWLGWSRFRYGGPADSQGRLKSLIKNNPKPIWISELQAEAWEHQDAGKWQERPGSMSGQKLQQNVQRARELGVETVLLWGVEYWYWQRERGRMELWETAQSLLAQGD